MKKYTINFLLVCILFLLNACGNSNQQPKTPLLYTNKTPITIDLDSLKRDSNTFLYSSVFRSVKIISLDSSHLNSLIGSVYKIHSTNEFIFVFDYIKTQKIFIFDKNGKFIQTIGSIGGGPGELSRLQDFTVDKEKNELYILDSNAQTVNKYSIPFGEFLMSFPINSGTSNHSHHIQYHDGSLFLDIRYYGQDVDYLIQQICPTTGVLERKLLKRSEVVNGGENLSFMIKKDVFYSNGKSLRFAGQFMASVIGINKNEVYPAVEIKTKKLFNEHDFSSLAENNPIDIYNKINSMNKLYEISDYIENDSFVWFAYRVGKILDRILYDKKTKKTKSINGGKNDLLISRDDLYFPLFPIIFGCTTQEGVYFYIDSPFLEAFKESINDNFFSSNIEGLDELKRADVIENPVLVYYEFK